MCTVTFLARQNGYALGMNRDEQLTRVAGLPPRKGNIGARQALFPSEPAGGTWIGVNNAGVTFALINWYAVNRRVASDAVSRGAVTLDALGCDTVAGVESHLADFPLARTNPFRLLGVFPRESVVMEWRWDLQRLEARTHPWQTGVWISSGHDEAGAQLTRGAAFAAAVRAGGLENLNALRALHASHEPACGPYSVCMHRSDAATVSYTEVATDNQSAVMRYSPGPLCGHFAEPQRLLRFETKRLRLAHPRPGA